MSIEQECLNFAQPLIDAMVEVAERESEHIAREVLREAVLLVPRKSGLLESRAAIREPQKDKAGWRAGFYAPHAHLVEFGHMLVDWRTGETIKHVSAKPFLRPAAFAWTGDKADDVAETVVEAIRARIRRGP